MSRTRFNRGRPLRLPLAAALPLLVLLALAPARGETPTGIYVLSTGRDNPNTPQDDRLANIRSYDFVSGYTLRAFWADLEPAPGQYDFSVIDAAIASLSALGQGLSLEILMGEEPSYVLAGAAATYQDHRGGTNPVPWDSYAQQRHAALFSALGTHVVTGVGAPHLLSQNATLKSIDAAPVGLNFGVRDLNGAIRAHPDYTQRRYIDAVVAGVGAAAAAFPEDTNFLAFFAFNDSQPGQPVDEQLMDRLELLYNGPGQTELAFFVENLSDDGPMPTPNGMGTGNNLKDWAEAGGSTMMQALDSWLAHPADRDAQLDSLNPATGISLANGLYGTRFFELYKTDLDLAALGAVDATGRLLSDDLRYWNALLNADADFDDNGSVDATDFSRWAEGFGIPVAATNLQGDADGDRDVDGNDFLLWQRQLGAPARALVAPVPEPAITAHAVSLAVALASLRRSRREKRKNVSPYRTWHRARRQGATRAPLPNL
jgi:hypothetical protein